MNKKLINTIVGFLEIISLLVIFTFCGKLNNPLAELCFLFLFCLYFSIKSVTMLYHSVCFYKDIKKIPQKKIKTVSAVVVSSRYNSTTTKRTKAVYTLNNKEIKGKMICSYIGQLDPDDKIRVIPDKRNVNLFAFSFQHIKDAVLTYSVFSILSVSFTVFMLAGIIYELIHM